MLPSIDLGKWAVSQQLHNALHINILFVIGVVLAFLLQWGLRNYPLGHDAETSSAITRKAHARWAIRSRVSGLRPPRLAACSRGVGGAYLSLVYPGSWNEGLSSGQGLMAVALVIFARWQPLRCLWAALLFGAAGALGPALQAIGGNEWLLPLQRRTVCAHACDHDRQLPPGTGHWPAHPANSALRAEPPFQEG